jgi:urease accessory protein
MRTVESGTSPLRSKFAPVYHGPLRVGIGGPVGSGKTALVEALCKQRRCASIFEISTTFT